MKLGYNWTSVQLRNIPPTWTIPNDFVWIFAGGEPPTAFLKKVGVGFANRDITTEGSREAKAALEAKQDVLTPA